MVYHSLSKELTKRIIADRQEHKINPYRCNNEDVIRRNPDADKANLWRPAFVRDAEKIMHLPMYNRYADKTQVFSFYNNDDITRRALHVQLVSRIARNIGAVLGLNLDLIEAIALGHDIGHTPFGHPGEKFLSELLNNETGLYFNHNVHSVRVLDKLFCRNISLQTLDGILCHNGEFEMQDYIPSKNTSFEVFDEAVDDCYKIGAAANNSLIPATLEGCVVRISDIVAYIGKDRQDAMTAKIIDENTHFSSSVIGDKNASIINNITVDIIENSYGKDCIRMSDSAYKDLSTAKSENYKIIYCNEKVNSEYGDIIRPMFVDIFYKLIDDIKSGDENTIVFKHHINLIRLAQKYYIHNTAEDYEKNDPCIIAADFIASMTDDYFLALYKELFPNSQKHIDFKSYFDNLHHNN